MPSADPLPDSLTPVPPFRGGVWVELRQFLCSKLHLVPVRPVHLWVCRWYAGTLPPPLPADASPTAGPCPFVRLCSGRLQPHLWQGVPRHRSRRPRSQAGRSNIPTRLSLRTAGRQAAPEHQGLDVSALRRRTRQRYQRCQQHRRRWTGGGAKRTWSQASDGFARSGL